ncbi:MAG: hypothetical protein LC657_11350, partial [Desulfobacteraceae bacterium]|nr:hypothetical protein [Desulfobacteraceae bacterium]
MTEKLTLATLFMPREMFALRDAQPGPAQGVNLRIGVSTGLDSPDVWAALANLCARVSFESLILDHSIIDDIRKIAENEPCIAVVLEPVQVQTGHAAHVTLHKVGPGRVHMSGTCTSGLSRVLNSLAAGVFQLASKPETDPIAPFMLAPADTITFCFDAAGNPTTFTSQNNPKKFLELADLSVCSHQGLKNKNSLFSLLDFNRLYQTDPLDLSRRILNLVWSVASPRFSFASGKALCDAVCAMVMEATGIRLPLVVTTNHTSPPDCPCFFIKELSQGQEDTPDNLQVQLSELPCSVHISGTAAALSEQLPVWTDLGLNHGGPGFARVEAIRRKAIQAGDIPVQEKKPVLSPIVHEIAWESETDDILAALSRLEQGNGFLSCHIWISKPPDIRSNITEKVSELLAAKGYLPDVQV